MEDLQQQIADYQAIAQQAKSAGRKLVQRLKSLGWTMLERVFDYDGPVMISPELMAHEDWEWAFFDDDMDWHNVDYLTKFEKTEIDWSDHIVEISVID
jgi:hypothetical protein